MGVGSKNRNNIYNIGALVSSTETWIYRHIINRKFIHRNINSPLMKNVIFQMKKECKSMSIYATLKTKTVLETLKDSLQE